MKLKNKFYLLTIFLSAFLLFSACFGGKESAGSDQSLETAAPTPTEAPMAVRVNGEGILLTDYEAEIKRYQAGVSQLEEPYDEASARQEVLDYLIMQTIFAQAAHEQGYSVSEADIQERIAGYVESLGGEDQLAALKTDNFYNEESFARAIKSDMAYIWMRDKLIDQVPQTAEQVHARQIVVKSENEALGIQRQLEVGTSFRDLAFQYDALTGGDLGWFPRGYLLQPDVETAAFALQPGQFSGIIPTDFGYHIVEVIERDTQKKLSQDALLFVQRQSLQRWLDDQLANSEIEILVP